VDDGEKTRFLFVDSVFSAKQSIIWFAFTFFCMAVAFGHPVKAPGYSMGFGCFLDIQEARKIEGANAIAG
jgi:hypothetical protein